jgi:hypothetical protein
MQWLTPMIRSADLLPTRHDVSPQADARSCHNVVLIHLDDSMIHHQRVAQIRKHSIAGHRLADDAAIWAGEEKSSTRTRHCPPLAAASVTSP